MLVATRGLSVYAGPADGSIAHRGTLPAPSLIRRPVQSVTTAKPAWALVRRLVGRFPRVTVEPITTDRFVATVGDRVCISEDGGRTWSARQALPASSPPFGVLPSAICHHQGHIYIGTYPLDDDETPHLLESTDGGLTWHTHPLPAVRHIHAVQVDPYTGEIWVTTGDRDYECHIGRLDGMTFDPVGGGSQDWRAVELAFTPQAVLWGVDCGYRSTNPILRLDRSDIGHAPPVTVERTAGSVYYAATVDTGSSTSVVFSTAAEVGIDSTASSETPSHARTASVLVASDDTEFTRWRTRLQLPRREAVADRLQQVGLPRTSAYVFLARHDGAIIANPHNTASLDGTLIRLSVSDST